jgi:two-component system KDP operon response regulator KdpE
MQQQRATILAVDDEPRYLLALKAILQGVGYRIHCAPNGRAAVELAAVESPDVILMDAKMPDMDGYEACRRIREFSTVPIIMLTALADEKDKVRGLDAGADDYVTKPFGAKELLARIRAVLRRVAITDAPDACPMVRAGELELDLAHRRVRVRGQEVHLTPTEYRLLSELAKAPNRVLTLEYLLERVWGPEYGGEYQVLRQVVYRLRRKIEPNPQQEGMIQNRPGIGYVFVV